MKNSKLALVLKIACIVLCVALIITGSVFIAAYVMQDDIDVLQTKLDGASGEIADLKEKYAAALQELDALKGDQVQTKTELDELRGAHQNTTQELGMLVTQVDALKEALKDAEAETEALMGEYEALKQKIEILNGEYESAKQEIETLNGEYEAAKQEIESLKAQLDALGSEDTRIRIYIDQGHNPTSYHNAGATGNGYYEQDLTFTIGKLLAERLEADGRFAVCLSRPTAQTVLGTDNDSSLDARVEGAKDFEADYFISLHTNSYTNESVNGFEIFTAEPSGESYRFGNYLRPYLAAATNLRDRGMKQNADLRVLKNATMPAILIEMGFISNPIDASLMAEQPELFANSIYSGILSYFDFSATAVGE